MRFVRLATYRHKNTLDMDIEVIKVQFQGPNYIKLKVNFINRSRTIIFALAQNITIQKKDLWLWERVK